MSASVFHSAEKSKESPFIRKLIQVKICENLWKPTSAILLSAQNLGYLSAVLQNQHTLYSLYTNCLDSQSFQHLPRSNSIKFCKQENWLAKEHHTSLLWVSFCKKHWKALLTFLTNQLKSGLYQSVLTEVYLCRWINLEFRYSKWSSFT